MVGTLAVGSFESELRAADNAYTVSRTITISSSNQQRWAVILALLVLAASGAGHRWLVGQYARATESVPIPSGTLARLPMSIGAWRGTDEPMEEEVIKATDTDDYVRRSYARGGRELVGLWVAYGVRFRDLMPHRPEVCYPGAGWTPEWTRQVKLMAPDGREVPCTMHRFVRGALGNERMTVLNYYLVDGDYSSDVSAVRKRVWRFKSGLRYVTQVQISSSDSPLRGPAEQSVSDFASDSAVAIRELLDQAVAAANPSGVHHR